MLKSRNPTVHSGSAYLSRLASDTALTNEPTPESPEQEAERQVALADLKLEIGFLAALRLDWGSVLRSLFNIAKASSGGLPPLMSCAGVGFEVEMTFSLLLPLAAAPRT